jgi:glycosyltransferase involved in cell wall biosynthesis
MNRLLIVAPFCSLPGEPHFNRFLYLAGLFSEKFDVTLVTSSFRHFDKMQRERVDYSDCKFEVVLIDEPGYKGNVSFSRIYSHHVFCENFNKWLSINNDFEIIYSAYPLIETNKIIASLRRCKSFKFIVDVQDVWPESITSFFPLARYLPSKLLPFSKKANSVYMSADALVAVSGTYLARAMRFSISKHAEVVYIGSDCRAVEVAIPKSFNGDSVRLFYLGALSHSYDLETVVKGMAVLQGRGHAVELHILGGGPTENKLKEMAGGNVFFHGFLKYSEMISFALGCHVAINPIKTFAAQTVTNKLSDYLSLGMPILNSQRGSEVLNLLSSVRGENYQAGSVRSFVSAAERLLPHARSAREPNTSFDREVSYKRILRLVEEVCNEKSN